MKNKLNNEYSVYSKGRLIPFLTSDGFTQMKIDLMLLEDAVSTSRMSPIFRFYRWKGSWLSIGKNQTDVPKKWTELVKEGRIQIVRRPTGGNAVLHIGGLTYSLIWPSPPSNKIKAYLEACNWIIKGFSELGMQLEFGNQPINPTRTNCFETSTSADLIDSLGNKRVGNAQLWKKGHLLQHGEILLDPPEELWVDLFNTNPPPKAPNSIPREGLDIILSNTFKTCWQTFNWEYQNFSKDEINTAFPKSK